MCKFYHELNLLRNDHAARYRTVKIHLSNKNQLHYEAVSLCYQAEDNICTYHDIVF